MSLIENPCQACIVYNNGIENALADMQDGDITGLGKTEFYLKKMLEHKVDSGISDAMMASCRSCENISIYDKSHLQEAIEKINYSENLLEGFPEDLRADVLKKAIDRLDELYNEPRGEEPIIIVD
jgi:hypothetical protein